MRKFLKRFIITFVTLAVFVVGIRFVASYYLKQSGITYDSIDFDFPSTLTFQNLIVDSEDVFITSKYAYINWRWKSVYKGYLSGELLKADDLLIQLKPSNPNDTSSFEFSDIPFIQFDEVIGSNIKYVDKDGLDSMIVELPSVYAKNIFLDNGIFTDSITAKNATFIMSFPDSTVAEDTNSGSALSDIIHINANSLELQNGQIQINYPDEQYEVKKIDLSLKGLGTNNPIEFKLNNLSIVYQDSIELSSNGNELYISQAGDVKLKQFSFSSPLFDLSVNKAEITADDRYYLSIKKTHINSDFVRMFVADFPLAAGTNMVFDGGIGWENDRLIFNHFEISLDKKTKTILDGFAIYNEELVTVGMNILTFKSTLFELQRLFDLEKIENQKDIDIISHFLVTGNSTQLTAIGNAELNKNNIGLNVTYSQKQNNERAVQLTLTSAVLNPNHIITTAPNNLAIKGVYFKANTLLDSNNNMDNISVEFACSSLNYNDYKVTDLGIDVAMSASLSKIKIKTKEQDFNLYVQTADNILVDDFIRFTGGINVDIPVILNPLLTAGNAKAPITGSFRTTKDRLNFDIKFDSLLFVSNSLEYDYVNKIAFSYATDTTNNIAIALNIDDKNTFGFRGEQKTFEWMTNLEFDSTNYPLFKADLQVRIDSNLFEVLVGTPGSVNISSLKVSTTKSSVDLSLISPVLVYNEYRTEGVDLHFATNFKWYKGNLVVDSLSNPYTDINNLEIKLASTNQYKVESDLYFILTDFEESIDFGIELINTNETKIVKLKDERALKFGSRLWDVIENEGATFDRDWNFKKGSFKINSDSQQIAVTTQNEIIDITISDFKVGPLFKVLTGDSLMSGLLNLQSTYNVKNENFSWNGKLSTIKVDTLFLGDFTSSGLFTSSYFKSDQKLVGRFSELFIALEKDKESPLQYNLDLRNFDLSFFNSFSKPLEINGEIEGVISGKLKGEVADATTASGYINIDKAKVQLQDLGIYVAIPNGKIIVDKDALLFTNFVVKDIEDKSLVINGTIPFQSNKSINIQAKTKQFKLARQENKSKDYWGNINISSDIVINGNYDKIAISGYLKLQNFSNIGYRYKTKIQVNRLQDEISFVSFLDTTSHTIIKRRIPKQTKIDWDLEVDFGKTKVYVLLYELSSDYLRLDASGKLRFKSGQGNIPNVYGKIESKSGRIYYEVPMVSNLDLKINYASVKFVGDIKNPIISFTGAEVFRVSSKEIAGQSNKKGSLVSVKVIAKVKESSIDEFELKFDLQSNNAKMGSFLEGLPSNTREAYAMNLLIFGSMTGASGGEKSTMQAVISKLNEISRRNIHLADLAFYVNTENNTYEKKVESIEYNFSKGFFDEKVNISVGGDAILGNTIDKGQQKFNPLGSVEIDYQLNKEPDIKAFVSKKNSYLGPVDGQVDKYSAGISFSKWFKNIFYKSKSKQESE
ncbi:MAG: translocation/assembly module TamB [Cyclobacteriaceae bacterium]|nr:translocation/assembly module TamB [Cyclobacteriaceae bacterium]